ncbi:STM3941 family protein [uncultured Chryseobacterium sp.]|uniref:STM3941 family protein n=1 Tax=uncultured Chryseobacterium sp. TaxID=259322 RepID=UPI00342052A2
MNEIHFYSSKSKSTILLILSSVFVYFFIHYYEKITSNSLFVIMISHFGFLLFSFGIIYSILLLCRRKPLLTINNVEIIIFDPLRKPTYVPSKNIASFYITSNSYRGIKTSEQINIVMKNEKLRKNKLIRTIFPRFENVYAIQTNLLNIKTKKLIVVLNSYLKNNNT